MRNLATCVPQVKLLVGLHSWLVWFHHAHTRLGTDWRWTGWLTGRWAGRRSFVLFLLHSILGLGTDLGFSEICCCWLQLLLLVRWLNYLAQACSDTARHSDSSWVTSSPDAADWPCLSTQTCGPLYAPFTCSPNQPQLRWKISGKRKLEICRCVWAMCVWLFFRLVEVETPKWLN